MLSRQILSRLPKQLRHVYPVNTIMIVRKPLYGVPEAGNHWWATYHKHHVEKLGMEVSTFDPCLMITTTSKELFGLVGMQTDDTLGLSTEEFAILEDEQLRKANLQAKPKEVLSPTNPLAFNGCILSQEDDVLYLRQKNQGKKIKLIDLKSNNRKKEYIEQRARGAYIATIC